MLSDVSLCLLTANGEIGIVERFLFSASVGWLYGNDGGASRRAIGC